MLQNSVRPTKNNVQCARNVNPLPDSDNRILFRNHDSLSCTVRKRLRLLLVRPSLLPGQCHTTTATVSRVILSYDSIRLCLVIPSTSRIATSTPQRHQTQSVELLAKLLHVRPQLRISLTQTCTFQSHGLGLLALSLLALCRPDLFFSRSCRFFSFTLLLASLMLPLVLGPACLMFHAL